MREKERGKVQPHTRHTANGKKRLKKGIERERDCEQRETGRKQLTQLCCCMSLGTFKQLANS